MFPTDQQKRLQVVNSSNPSLRSVAAPFSLQGGNFSLQGAPNVAAPQLPNNIQLGPVQVARPGGLRVGNQVIQQTEGQTNVADRTPRVNPFIAGLKSIGNSVINPVERAANTYGALYAGVGGLADAGFQSVFGSDQSYNQAVRGTNNLVDSLLSHGIGNQGGYLTPTQAASSGGGFKSLKNNFVKPLATGTAQVAPLVLPFGKVGEGLSLGGRMLAQGAVNAGVGGGTDALQQYINTGKVNPGEVLKTGAVSGTIGAAVPLASKAVGKVFSTPSEQTQFVNYLSKEKDVNAIHDTLANIYGGTSAAIKQAAVDIAHSPNKRFIINRLAELPEEGAAIGVGGEIAKNALQSETDNVLKARETARQQAKQQAEADAHRVVPMDFGTVDPRVTPEGTNVPTGQLDAKFTPEEQAVVDGLPNPPKPDRVVASETRRATSPETAIPARQAATIQPPKSALPAVTKMVDTLNTGGTVDEALNDYMLSTGSNIGEAKVALQKLLKQKGVDRGSINASLNPKFNEVSVAPVAKGSGEQAILNSKTIRNEIIRYGNKALQAVDRLSEHDHQLMDAVRSTPLEDLAAQADNPEAFREATQTVKDYNDYTHAAGSGLLGQEVPYRQNYGAPLFFDRSAEGQAALESAQKAALKNSPSYGKSRTFKDYNEAVSYGAKRLHQNFSQDLAHDISRRSNDLSQLTLHQGLEDAFPGQVKVGEIGSTPEGNYSQLQIPGGQKLSMPQKLADQINRRAQPTETQGFVRGYDTVNKGLKYIKLGGGAFHAVTEAGNFIGQQILSGKFFTEPGSTAKVFKTFFSSKSMAKEMATLEDKGVVRNADLAGLVRTPEGILADANVSIGSKAAKYSGIKTLHDATFQREIPYAKLKTFEQKTEGLDFNNPQDVAQARAIAKEINQNYGGINRAVEGLTPKTFKSASRFVLATDFTEGKIRTLVDALSKGGPEGKLAREVVLGKALLFGGLATAGGALAGEYQNKTPQEVAKTILEKFADPKFTVGGSSVAFPATHVSEFTRPFESFFNGTKDKFSGLKHYATGRLAAVPSEINQLANNLDYSGNHIYGKNTKKNGGQPFTPLETAANVARGFTPIPASQGIGVGTGKTSPLAAVANTVGFRVSPNQDKSGKALNPGDNEVAVKDANGQPVLDSKGKPTTVVIPKGVTGAIKDQLVFDATQKAVVDQMKRTLSPQEKAAYDLGNSKLEKLHNEGKLDDATYNHVKALYAVSEGVKSGLSPDNKKLARQSDTVIQKAYDDGKINDATFKEISDYKDAVHRINGKGDYSPEGITNPDAQAFYKKYNSQMTAYDQKKLLKLDAPVDDNVKRLTDSLNETAPSQLKFKPTNQLAKDYAEYEKDINTHPDYDEVDKLNKLKKFLVNASKNQHSEDVQSIYSEGGDGDLKKLQKAGKINTDSLGQALALDDALYASGAAGSLKFSKKWRSTYGFNAPPAAGSLNGLDASVGASDSSGSGGSSGTGQYVSIGGKKYKVTAEGTPVEVTGSDGQTKVVRVNAQGLSSGPTGLSSFVPGNLSFKTASIDTTPKKLSFKVNLPPDVRGNPRPQKVASTRYTTVRIK